ncbi:MAG: Cas9 inhibitor AcrIIA9 family protein [Clostridia bacterium]|nr:Cas9 inhibitor AcrIIA9 family protein [Clostridia bacterium]
MTGVERLQELSLAENDVNISKIVDYLITRPDLDNFYLSEEKSLKQMMKVITDKAKKSAVNNCAMIEDKVVYVWAVMYFITSNEKLGLNKIEPEVKVETKKEEPKQDEKKLKDTSQINMFEED